MSNLKSGFPDGLVCESSHRTILIRAASLLHVEFLLTLSVSQVSETAVRTLLVSHSDTIILYFFIYSFINSAFRIFFSWMDFWHFLNLQWKQHAFTERLNKRSSKRVRNFPSALKEVVFFHQQWTSGKTFWCVTTDYVRASVVCELKELFCFKNCLCFNSF